MNLRKEDEEFLEGLTIVERNKALRLIQIFRNMGVATPYGIIQKEATKCKYCCFCDEKCNSCIEDGYECTATFKTECCPYCSGETNHN